jgi:HEPN domain-containing protein
MKPHEAWLVKAEHDLLSARMLMAGEPAVLDTAIYHAQQCAEKALKAYLSFKFQPIQRTHDVEFLVELCADLDPSFTELTIAARLLTPYAAAFRYPDIILEPDATDVAEAIEKGADVLSFVKGIISKKQ